MVDRILAHEGVGCLDGQLLAAALVIGIHQLELDLPAQVAERITRLDCLENLDAAAIIAALDRALCQVIGFL